MKKTVITIFAAVFIALVFPYPTSAHPGRTAADGCHYCRTNCDKWGVAWNERHCHGGGSSSGGSAAGSSNVAPIQTDTAQTIQAVDVVYPTAVPTLIPTRVPTRTPTPTKARYTETDLDRQKLFKVVSVIDGDTIDVSIRGAIERVRLLAIDTPETKDPRKPVQCFGIEATKKLQSLLSGNFVKLIDDRSQGNRDKYQRLLRYVYVGRLFVNAEMVKQGYAFSYKEYPTKYLEQFNILEQQAREKNLGLWKACK